MKNQIQISRYTAIAFIFSAHLLFAQASEQHSIPLKKNYIFLEGGGIARLGSVNYERMLFDLGNGHFSLRLGLGTGLIDYSLPIVGVNYFVGTRNHFFEVSLTGSKVEVVSGVFFNDKSGSFYSISPSIGYRKTHESGFFLRLALTPIFNVRDYNAAANNAYQLWAGLGLGWDF